MTALEPRRRWWRTLLLLTVVGCASWPLLYQLLVLLVPNRTSDGHVVMPIGQVMGATLLAPLVGLWAAWRFGRGR